VARYGVVLINPVQSIQADLAEETLDEYIRWLLDAQQEQLAEHREYGLPDFEATGSAFERDGWKILSFPAANVHNWLFMMVAKHYLISLRDERASAFERTLDRFYNLTFSATDRAEPAYRGVLVAVQPGYEGALRRIEERYPLVAASESSGAERLQLAQLLMTMLDLKVANHEDRLLREQMEARDKHIAAMETRIDLQDRANQDLEDSMARLREEHEKYEKYIARLEAEQKDKNEHILYLERLLQGIEAGRVMRLTRTFARFLGRS
jgi:hypothetical protein